MNQKNKNSISQILFKKHYRVLIQKDECLNRLRYYPQIRFLWFWCDLFEWPVVSFKTYDAAYQCIKEHIIENKITNYVYQVVDNN